MGRRARNHSSVRYIVVFDRNGEEEQRLELDDSGKLITKAKLKPVRSFSQPEVIPPPAYLEQQMRMIPMPPAIRSKPCPALLSALKMFKDYEPFRAPPVEPTIPFGEMELNFVGQPILAQ